MIQIGEAVAGFWEKIGVKVEMKTVGVGRLRSDEPRRAEGPGGDRVDVPDGRPAGAVRRATSRPSPPRAPQHLLRRSRRTARPLCQEADKAYEAVVSREGRRQAQAATNRMIELVAKSWMAVPIIEGMGIWAVNPKRVGQFKPIPGRHEFGDVAERMPRPEQRPWP